MAITETIRTRWTDLSDRAQDHIRETRPTLLNRWELWEEGYHYDTIAADSAEEALEAAKANVDRANYADTTGTIYISVSVRNPYTGDTDDATVTVEADEPECIGGHDHDWQSPIALVGGIESNPGVWGHGAGLIIHEACLRCGCRKTTDTWAQDPDTGGQGRTSVEYAKGAYGLEDMGYVVEERLDTTAPLAAPGAVYSYVVYGDDGAHTAYAHNPHVWTVRDRSDDTYTIAEGEDAAREIAYRCRAGHAADYVWQDEEGR